MSYKTPRKNKIYHVYNRGNHRALIGKSKDDFDFLYRLTKDVLNIRSYELLCFCIMPNHYHILVSQTGRETISRGMHLINSTYAKYYNSKYGISGHLFQGTYHRKWVIGADALILTYAYIINNPKKIRSRKSRINSRLYENKFLLRDILARNAIRMD